MTGEFPTDPPTQPDWYTDPFGRHDYRYYDGQDWTAHVADQGSVTHDPPRSAAQMIPPPPPGSKSRPEQHTGRRSPSGLSFGEAVKRCLSLYATFQGRAARSEYWWFLVFTFLATFVAAFLGGTSGPEAGEALIVLTWLALLLPALAVTVRRLHDIDKRGWWILIFFVPFGPLVLLLFMVASGTPEANRFGLPPG